MKCLLKKDFMYFAEQKIMLLLMIGVAVIVGRGDFGSVESASGFVAGYITVVSVFVALSTVGYDEEDGGMAQVFMLPVTRKMYVESKYILSVTVIFAAGCLAGLLLLFMIRIEPEETLPIITMMTGIALALTAVELPAYLKFGSRKGMVAGTIGIAAIVFLTAGVVEVMGFYGVDIHSVIANMTMEEKKAAVLISPVAGLILLLLSYVLSLRIVISKEY